jgi:hypothetical protein
MYTQASDFVHLFFGNVYLPLSFLGSHVSFHNHIVWGFIATFRMIMLGFRLSDCLSLPITRTSHSNKVPYNFLCSFTPCSLLLFHTLLLKFVFVRQQCDTRMALIIPVRYSMVFMSFSRSLHHRSIYPTGKDAICVSCSVLTFQKCRSLNSLYLYVGVCMFAR